MTPSTLPVTPRGPDKAASGGDPMRLFIALWPPGAVARALRGWYARAAGPRAAPGEPAARLHLTLHFLGDVPRARLADLQDALCLPFTPFELQLRGCEHWPHGLVVAPPDAAPPALFALHAALGQRLGALGLRTEGRSLRPHVTLARHHVGAWSPPSPALAPLHWPVRQYVLAESVRGPPAAYRILQTCTA